MNKKYQFLPFRFKRFCDTVLLVNDSGQYTFLSREDFDDLTHYRLSLSSELFMDLETKNFVCAAYTPAVINRCAKRFRTKKRFLFESTALHMFVITHRCNQSCAYCHASSTTDPDYALDMSPDTARRCVEVAFETPSPDIKIEFQGGEPTLNFKTIMAIVEHAKACNTTHKKNVQFVLCTNLYELPEQQLEFYTKHGIHISTSLDGPAHLHDVCRKTKNGSGTHDCVNDTIKRVRSRMGEDSTSALLTVTDSNIMHLREAIDHYIANGFTSIFIRMLNPFGQAQKNWQNLGYDETTFLRAYFDALEYIVDLNRQGRNIREELAVILLSKIVTPFAAGFVDIQSPSGSGIGGMIYDVDGKAFVSDEARMLYRSTGDEMFSLGNVLERDRAALFTHPILRDIMERSVLEALPGCAWCVYQPYCGIDPVRNYALYKRLSIPVSLNTQCTMHKNLFDYFFMQLSSEDETLKNVYWAWLTARTYEEVAFPVKGAV